MSCHAPFTGERPARSQGSKRHSITADSRLHNSSRNPPRHAHRDPPQPPLPARYHANRCRRSSSTSPLSSTPRNTTSRANFPLSRSSQPTPSRGFRSTILQTSSTATSRTILPPQISSTTSARRASVNNHSFHRCRLLLPSLHPSRHFRPVIPTTASESFP